MRLAPPPSRFILFFVTRSYVGCCLCASATGGVALQSTCRYTLHACNDPEADNYISGAVAIASGNTYGGIINTVVFDPLLCAYAGCNDTTASNYDSTVRWI